MKHCSACNQSVETPHQCPAVGGRYMLFDEDVDWDNRQFRDPESREWCEMPKQWTKVAR